MRMMSFALTTQQILNRTKTVTRRCGWRFLKPGDLIQAIEKGQGLKKGEKVRRLCVLRVEDVRVEPVDALLVHSWYGHNEVIREGFAGVHTPQSFAEFFASSHGCTLTTPVTRIEFSYQEATHGR